MNDYQKYVKYKTKYLKLKQMKGGGGRDENGDEEEWEKTHFASVLRILADKLTNIYKIPDDINMLDWYEKNPIEAKCNYMRDGFISLIYDYFSNLNSKDKEFKNIDTALDNAIELIQKEINRKKDEDTDGDEDEDEYTDENKYLRKDKDELQIVMMVGTTFIEIITKMKDESKKYYANFIYLLFKKIFLENNNEKFQQIISAQHVLKI